MVKSTKKISHLEDIILHFIRIVFIVNNLHEKSWLENNYFTVQLNPDKHKIHSIK
jgi:hypothetical protein